MPHQCTNCGHVFADGSKDMLAGCPDCGGNKFQYHPGEVPEQPSQDEPPERPENSGVTGTVGKAAAKVRDLVGDDEPGGTPASGPEDSRPAETQTDPTPPAAEETTTSATAAASTSEPDDGRDSEEVPERDDEDLAQQSARSDMVTEDDLPPASERPTSEEHPSSGERATDERPPSSDRGRVVSEPSSEERPDMDALREELNSQFESIRIVSPGTYELNLMELYDREEYIIALQENGRYVIEVPDAWEVENADDTE